MNFISDLTTKTFSLNGVTYFKNFYAKVGGDNITIVGVYDSKNVLLAPTPYDQVDLGGTVYNSADELATALLFVLYSRVDLGTASEANFLGNYDTYNDLITAHPTAVAGNYAFLLQDENLVDGIFEYRWNTSTAAWEKETSLDPQGDVLMNIQGQPYQGVSSLLLRFAYDQFIINQIQGGGISIAIDPAILGGGGGGAVDSVVAGNNITVDNTDASNPIVALEAGQTSTVPFYHNSTGLLKDSQALKFDETTGRFMVKNPNDVDGVYISKTEIELSHLSSIGAAYLQVPDDLTENQYFTFPPETGSGLNTPFNIATREWVTANAGGGSSPQVVTTLPASIPVDGTKVYHIQNGIIKPANTGNVEGKEVEIISNPANGDSLVIDLREYSNTQLQGGGFTESPPNYYTLETDEANGLLKQHLTLFMWRRDNLFASNSLNHRISPDVNFFSTANNNNEYVTATFNKVVLQGDLVIGNFTPTFTQNGDTATGVTLDSITDENGNAISENTSTVRIYFTITGTTNGNGSFVINATSLSDTFGNTSTNQQSDSIGLVYAGDPIVAMDNVVAYWKEGEGDNTTGTATKTDVKNSKVLSATGEDNPTLSGTEWVFDGVNDGFRCVDATINAIINADDKDFQIHYRGNYKANSTRIACFTDVGVSPNSLWNLVYKVTSNIAFNVFDAAGDSVTEDIMSLNTGQDALISLKFHRKDLGAGIVNALDVYVDTGGVPTSVLDVDLSVINVSNVEELFWGMRETTSKQFYNVGVKSMVIANTSANFDSIRTELAL